jgi:hypothetical protein
MLRIHTMVSSQEFRVLKINGLKNKLETEKRKKKE